MAGKNVHRDEPQGGWNLTEIREILDLLNQQGISEFELENNGFRMRIKRGREAQVAPEGASVTAAAADSPHFGVVHPSPHAPPPAAQAARASAAEMPGDAQEGLHIIKSPIVGTFYAAPGPDVDPFVAVGDAVQPGTVLCIIEAMKLMNEIEAEVAGKIARIFVENGQPVEYGQALFGLDLPA